MKLSFIENYIINAIATHKAEELDWQSIEAVREAYTPKQLLKYYNDVVMTEKQGDIRAHLEGIGLDIDFEYYKIKSIAIESGLISKNASNAQLMEFASNWFKLLEIQIFTLSKKFNAFATA